MVPYLLKESELKSKNLKFEHRVKNKLLIYLEKQFSPDLYNLS
jgi:hypothetical protein